MDTRTPAQRRFIMQSVKTRNTGPEVVVQKLARRMGLRFLTDDKNLHGKPDLVFPKHRIAMFVHGCFWHGHSCAKGKLPKSSLDFWKPKIQGNKKRDARVARALRKEGWGVITIWQCQTKENDSLSRRLLHVFHTRKNRRSTSLSKKARVSTIRQKAGSI